MNVLLIAYHFPPIGGAGVQRAVKLARYLPEFGINPTVLTGPGSHEDRWMPDDPSMLSDVRDVPVLRVPGLIPRSSARVSQINRLVGRRDAFLRWWTASVVRVGREQAKGIDVVVAELGPYETAFGAQRLADELGVPWVAELQDPWALDEMWLYPTALHRLADRKRMRRVLETAAVVVMNTPEAAARLRTTVPSFQDRAVVSIPNGFDSADFATDPLPRSDGTFRILHAGSLHTDTGLRHSRTVRIRRLLGGMPVPGVDILTRSHLFLIKAIEAVQDDDPALRDVIELRQVGSVTAVDREVAADAPFVRFDDYRSHTETIDLMRSADLLFLPMQNLPPGIRAGIVPAKTYEYIASGTPILAAVPDGDAREILLSAGTASVCRPADVDGMADALRARVDAWRRRIPTPRPDPAVLARFDYRHLAGELTGVLENVVAGKRAKRVAR